MTVKPIRSADDHAKALAAAARLMLKTDQKSVDQLEILQAVIERWERSTFRFQAPTPADAIKFRMMQASLKPRDLIPYLGTKSRVSEILAGQRQLTVDQIRALNRHLDIPVESLVGQLKHEPARKPSTASKAAVDKLRALGVLKPREHIDAFLARALRNSPALGLLRKSRTDRTNAKTDMSALEAWCAAVLIQAGERTLPSGKRKKVDASFARKLAKCSVLPDGPVRAVDELAKAGVILIVLEHLPGTFLDGAAMCRGDGAHVIALTLRHDRLDNFWFTLLHEVAHVSEHLGDGTSLILDDLDVNSPGGMEEEADEFAREALIPAAIWQRYNDPKLSTDRLLAAAKEAKVHPAIIAGRWRWEHGDFRKFSKLLGRGEVRNKF